MDSEPRTLLPDIPSDGEKIAHSTIVRQSSSSGKFTAAGMRSHRRENLLVGHGETRTIPRTSHKVKFVQHGID
jgi:hypothetical protein